LGVVTCFSRDVCRRLCRGSGGKDPVIHTLTIEIRGEGTVEPSAETQKVADGAMINLKAHPAENWEFEK
jgi:hypothetical protein